MDSTNTNNLFDLEVIQPLLLNLSRFANRNAFCIRDKFYTYHDLASRISNIRSTIKKLLPDILHVGLVANDDLDTYASILALWLEGKAYIPLHPKHPFDRSEEIIGEMSITTILDSSGNSDFSKYHVIHTPSSLNEESDPGNQTRYDPDLLVYVLFTSGSTGTPKGVMITRKNIGAFMNSFWDSGIEINEEDRCLQCFDLTFDVSVQSFLAPLVRGACVYTIPHEEIKYSYSYALLEDHQLTFCVFAPSMLRYLKPYFDEIDLPSVKFCILTAEASPYDLIKSWENCVPNARLFDFYGPTETTIYCTFYEIPKTEARVLNGMLSIGKSMKNVAAIVIDTNDNEVPKGERGELCIAGPQVCTGYWKNPIKNGEVFLQKYKERQYYRTGDLCFFNEEGFIMLYGRRDSQAKVQGYRVDLGELEHHARTFLNGGNAVVLTFNNNIGNTELALFVEGSGIDTAMLEEYMKTKVPAYFIPSRFIVETEFILNANSKVDKLKLREKLDQSLRENLEKHGK